MRRMKYHIYLNSEERCLLISSLNDLRNRLIAEGKYTDLVDEVMIKAANAKIKGISNNSMSCRSAEDLWQNVVKTPQEY